MIKGSKMHIENKNKLISTLPNYTVTGAARGHWALGHLQGYSPTWFIPMNLVEANHSLYPTLLTKGGGNGTRQGQAYASRQPIPDSTVNPLPA